MRGNWSVRELRRQIDSLYYQRSGLSKDKTQLSALAHAAADTLQPAHVIRDPYVFEFLGLRSRDVMAESDLEDALLDRLQDFLLELPPRQNSCRLHRTPPGAAMKDGLGSIRTGIQGQGGGEVAAAGERAAGGGGTRGWHRRGHAGALARGGAVQARPRAGLDCRRPA